MLAVAVEEALYGSARPRVAPPVPALSRLDLYLSECECIGVEPFPWQEEAGRYLYGVGPDGLWLYPEVAELVARQNGKTEQLVPHVATRLVMGRRIMHTAQNRELPREVFGRVADHFETRHAGLLSRKPRFANGQEEIRLENGGHYRIVAPTRGGARGPSNDDVIVDEVRELDSHDFIAAAKPTMNASPNPQILYLSNMGDESSEVLNAILQRSSEDPALACLQWSAAPSRDAGDVAGWLEANPSVGHLPHVMANLEREYRSHRLGGTLAVWETEHLCRAVASMRERLVDAAAWSRGEAELGEPTRPVMAVSLDPRGTRASAAIAWADADGRVSLRMLFDVTGSPINTDKLGRDLREAAASRGVQVVGFDPLTDALLAKFFPQSEAVAGQKFANATARFVSSVESGRLSWADCSAVTADLAFTTRKDHDESGSFQAVRGNDDRPITASLAAIRAVWLASEPSAARRPYRRGSF
jgi:phage terminase large subunit-like protein